MARYSEHDPTNIYNTAQNFRDNCLLRDGSLVFDGAALWQIDLLERIHEAFVTTPDEGDRSFIDKFRDQVKPAGQEVVRLAGELLCVYFLFPSSVGGIKKRQVVNEVFGWVGDSLPDTSLVSKAFEHGIGSGGQGYNTRRPLEIAFLIEFAIAWKKLTPDQQQETAADPWRFQELVESIDDAESKQLRHMLLHLLFPDSFERIASRNHKRQIITTFSGLITDESDNEDKNLLAIRSELETLLPNRDLDFYWPPLEAAWKDDTKTEQEEGMTSLELVQYKKQIVLYGPPGTGKTYTANRLAKTVIRSAALAKWGAARYFQSQADVEAAIKNNVHRRQLHPSSSYEDFVCGLHITDKSATEYRAGFLPRLIAEIEKQSSEDRLPHVLILDEMNRTDLSRMLGECFSLLEDRNQSIELPAFNENGEPLKLRIPDDLFVIGTMNLIDQSIEQIDFALRRRFLWQLCPFDAKALMAAAEAKWNDLNCGLAWDQVEADFRRLKGAAVALNHEIHNSGLLGSQYEIGHTYLLDVVLFLRNSLGPRPTRRQNYLWNRRGDALNPVTQVWNLSLRPLLEQYLAGLEANLRNTELEKLANVFLKTTVVE
jgi:5-methylcytosine-specific restriction enzyme B